MLWNANGIQKHKNELELVLLTEKIDICLIAETHFTTQSYLKICNYETYQSNHPMNNARGGSAILVRSNIDHYPGAMISKDEFQATTITVKLDGTEINVTALYSPPRHAIKAFQYKELFEQIGEKFIIGGDFNAKHTHWGSRLITPKGRELLKAANDSSCEFLSTRKPTYWPTDPLKVPDLIDFFVTRKISANYIKIEEGYDMNSDHSAIVLSISNNIIERETPPMLSNKQTDWTYFRHVLSSQVFNVPTNEVEIDDFAAALTTAIQSAAWNSTPNTTRNLPVKKYPNFIKTMVTEKRRLRRRWQRSRDPAVKTLLNKATKELSLAIKELENSSLNKYLSELSGGKNADYSLWKAVKTYKKPTPQFAPIKNPNNEWAKTNNQKATIFSEHLMNIFRPHEDCDNIPPIQLVHIEDEEIPICSTSQIKSAIKELKLKKAPGFDLITAEILREIPSNILSALTILINACFKLKYVPAFWKVAEVIMVNKPGKPPTEVSSYRPISLLPVISKLLEKMFLKNLMPIIERRDLIPNHQFGFRRNHSTIDQVHRIIHTINIAFDKKKICSAVFLDVSQAFDRVWHQGLIQKLRSSLPSSYCDFLVSYLHNRSFRVKYEDAFSELKPINAGVPQGSILGPILYLLYTRDVPTSENHTTATFADDTAILAIGSTVKESTENLQNALNSIADWTKKWKISLNNQKSVHVDFANCEILYHPLYIDNIAIPHSNTAKYLGMTLDAKLRWKEHVKKKKTELQIKLSSLYWLLGRRSKLSVENKLLIYNQVLKPVWTYGIQLWGCTSQTNIASIQRFQYKVLRTIVDCPWYVRNPDLQRDIGILPVVNVIQQFATAHRLRLSTHVNDEASRLIQPGALPRRLRRRRPEDLVPQ